MTKNDWNLIARRYRVALDLCKDNFVATYPEDWRSHIQDHQELLRYFKRSKIEIKVGEDSFEIKTTILTMRKHGYLNKEETERRAIIAGFRILNLDRGRVNLFS